MPLPERSPGRPPGRDRLALALLLGALAVGAVRFVALGHWSLWLDEALTLADARHAEEVHNPLGYWLFGLWFDRFDRRPDELLLRLPAAVFGWLSILLTWWAFRPFTGGRVAGAAALVLAVSTWHVYWSQNARFYTLAQALAIAGGGLLLRGLALGGAWRAGVGLALAALAALAHPSAVWLFVALVLAPWGVRRAGFAVAERQRLAWRLFGAAGVAAAILGSGWGLEVWSTWEGKRGGGSPWHFVKTTGYLVTPTLSLAVAAGVWVALRRRSGLAGRTAALVCVLVLASALAASAFARVSAQYVFVLLPWLAVTAALPLGALAPAEGPAPSRAGWASAAWLALLVLPGAAETTLYFTVRNGDRPHWREAYRHVFLHRRPEDLILGMEAPVGEFYLDPVADDLRVWRQVTWLDRFRARLISDWARYPRRTWLVVNDEQLEDWEAADRDRMRVALEEDFRLQASFHVPLTPRDLDVRVYLREARR